MKKKLLAFFWGFYLPFTLLAQVDDELAAIQKALAANDWAQANQLFQQCRSHYLQQEDYLNLSYFIPYAGYVAEKKGGVKAGQEAAEALLATVLGQSQNPRDFRQAWLEIHTYYLAVGKHQMAYDANLTALQYTYQMPGYQPVEWALIERNLGVIANLLGSPSLAKSHMFRALKGYGQAAEISPESQFNLLNDLGATYWYEAKWDSATFFWREALRLTETMEPTLTNQYYRKSMVASNLSAVYDVLGNPQESIRSVKSSIELIQYFLEHAQGDIRWDRAFNSLCYSMANLAAVYKSIGHYQQALQVHEYTLREKQKRFEAGHPEIIETLIHTGLAHYSLKNFAKAEAYLQKALAALAVAEGNYFIQLADAHHALARVYEGTGQYEAARQHYLQADTFFSKAFQNSYDYVYLGFLADASRFFSWQQEAATALNFARKGLGYITKIDGKFTVSGFSQLLNMGEVSYNLKNFEDARSYAAERLQVLEKVVQSAGGSLDAIRMESDKPQAMLLLAKANYQLARQKNVPFLQAQLEQLKGAYEGFTRRKKILSNSEDIAGVEARSHDLLAFMKIVLRDLYQLTNDRQYLEEMMVYQESGVYFRIRSRLNQAGMVAYSGVPPEVLDKEAMLKSQMNRVFEEDGGGGIADFFQLSDAWQELMVHFQTHYPAYYQACYATVRKEDIAIPHNAQLVRYFFVEGALHAMVFVRGEMHLFPLVFDEGRVNTLVNNWGNTEVFCSMGHALYRQLWEPFAHLLQEERVLVIPDGPLFNLSFDMLLCEKAAGFHELAEKSLLARHALHYRYSLSALSARPGPDPQANYVAFVPGFFDGMKEKYRNAVQDSTLLDRAYLSLLPQPFTLQLVEKVSKVFGGRQFVQEASTPAAFRASAGNHKIIHIGTHAESNNISPAYSRLIFAKTAEGQLESSDHSLYAYELYETNLSARLAILTACETAKPVYQPGEGMISLSHAFQYSGSESLLTRLWKIDEKASNQITEAFLMYLKEGMPKDQALRLAKLAYLQTARGRTLSPQYWAGLVLMGDPAPIEGLAKRDTRFGWVLLLFLGVLVLWAVGKKYLHRLQ